MRSIKLDGAFLHHPREKVYQKNSGQFLEMGEINYDNNGKRFVKDTPPPLDMERKK